MIARECCHVGPWEEKLALPINCFNTYVRHDGNLKLEKWVESIALKFSGSMVFILCCPATRMDMVFAPASDIERRSLAVAGGFSCFDTYPTLRLCRISDLCWDISLDLGNHVLS